MSRLYHMFGLVLISLFVVSSLASGQERDMYWSVTGVRADDVLHLRDLPSADSKSLAGIPPNAKGLKHLGCLRRQLPIDDYMNMTDVERKYARTLWCRVQFKTLQGWVAGRFLKDENGTGPK